MFGEETRQICNTPEELKEFLRSDRALGVYSNIQEMQAMANIFNMPIDIFTYGTREAMDGEQYDVAEWMGIQPMKEAAHLAKYTVGHFPPMALYHSTENHFDLLVADTSRLVTSGLLGQAEVQQVHQELSQVPVQLQEEGTSQTVPKRRSVTNTSGGCQEKKDSDKGFHCEECGVMLESRGLMDAHMFNHEEGRSSSKIYCDDCEEECTSEVNLEEHMKYAHDDGSWTCEDCQFQSNKVEYLRQHLKKNGHQPSEASRRQTNDIKECYTCKKEFEGYIALMNHRSVDHPSSKLCNKIPICTGWVDGRKCWYFHPTGDSVKNPQNIDHNPPSDQNKEIYCRRCGDKFPSKNKFMDHYITKHTSNIICRDWVKNNCKRIKCWYRHSYVEPGKLVSGVQTVPTAQDFTALLPPPQPPAQGKIQMDLHQLGTQMAMRMNNLELGISESRNQMHTLQQMLSKSQI